MASAEILNKTPLRILNKGPDYFRSANGASQNSEGRRKTAAERLEADKFKYVKSAKARQRRATVELKSSNSPNNDSTGTHSMGTASTGSPVTIDDDDISDYTANDITSDVTMESRLSGGSQYKPGIYQARQNAHRKLNRSNTDADMMNRTRFQNSNRLRHKSVNDQVSNSTSPATPVTKLKDLNCGPPDRIRGQSLKDGQPGKSLSAYLSKAKEGIKAAISGGDKEISDTPKGRQSRSVATKPSKYRSASVGANVHRQRGSPSGSQKSSNLTVANNSDVIMMSPRSQLKHARQNLKKVNSSSKSEENKVTDENTNNASPARKTGKTFTVIPKHRLGENAEKTETENNRTFLREKATLSEKQGRCKGRPLSVIENRVTQNVGLFTPTFVPSMNEKEMTNHCVRRRSSSSTKDDDQSSQGNDIDITMTSSRSGASLRRISSQRLKRRSWDLAHTMDNSLQLALPKPIVQPTSLTPDTDSMPTSPLTIQPRQRKSWSRAPPTSEYKKSGNRISFHEDTYQNKPGMRKSITEALEEIFTPLECDDDMDTAYNSMSPDASMDCKTLVGQGGSNYGEKSNNSIAENINSILRGIGMNETTDNLSRSKTPESSRSKTPTGDDGISFGANDVDITVSLPSEQKVNSKLTPNSSPASGRHRGGYQNERTTSNDASEPRQWLNGSDSHPITSQPLNRIDLAPTSIAQLNGGIPNSPMLAPRARREVAPDYSMRSNTASLNRPHQTKEEQQLNTMKSQNTSSSASGDVNKPFTALTASDLKPRRGKRTVMSHPSPIKPTCPYPMSNYRGNPKRHNNTPVSPTMSPHKQPARMTPPHGSRSSSSTPYSSLKRTPTSSRSSSLKRNRQRSKSDVSVFQSELDRFFSTMGMDETLISPLPASQDTLFTTAHVSSESDFSFAGASAYVRDSPDETMEVDPMTAGLANVPSVSIIEKNARVMRWLMSCKKSMTVPNTSPRSPRHAPHVMVPPVPTRTPRPYNQPVAHIFPHYPPPIPPRISSYQKIPTSIPKESDV